MWLHAAESCRKFRAAAWGQVASGGRAFKVEEGAAVPRGLGGWFQAPISLGWGGLPARELEHLQRSSEGVSQTSLLGVK